MIVLLPVSKVIGTLMERQNITEVLSSLTREKQNFKKKTLIAFFLLFMRV
jgi:hypothetical protein